jgi:hypothetical protein
VAGTPRPLFTANLASSTVDRNAWDLAPGGRFLLNQTATAVAPMTVVVNWLSGRDAAPAR